MLKRINPLLKIARSDDTLVVFRRGVYVVIVVVQTCSPKRLGLTRRQHPERGAGLKAHCLHARNHCRNRGHVPVFQLAPCGANTEALRPARLGFSGIGDDLVGLHQSRSF